MEIAVEEREALEGEVSLKVSWLEVFKRKGTAIFGAFLLLLTVFTAIFAPHLTHHKPLRLDVSIRLQGPSASHLLGTDEFGRDVFSRVIFGTRVSLLVGGAVMLFTSLVGVILGILAGYYDYLDNVLMRIMDGLMALQPWSWPLLLWLF